MAVAPSPPGLPGDDQVPAGAVVFRIDVPSAAAMVHVPTEFSGPLEINPEDQAWIDRFLAHAIVEPQMTEADVIAELGPDRDELAMDLLRLWSWLAVVDDAGRSTYPNLPSPRFMAMLATCAEFYKKPATEILRDWSFADLVVNWRVAIFTPPPKEQHDDFTRRVGVEA